MTQLQFIDFYATYKRGTYRKLIKEKTNGQFKKVTSLIVRFVNYYNIKTVKEKLKDKPNTETKNPDFEKQIIPHVLKLNLNTNNLLLCAYTTNKHKAHTKYYDGLKEITEDQYYLLSGDKKQTFKESVILNFKLNDVIAII